MSKAIKVHHTETSKRSGEMLHPADDSAVWRDVDTGEVRGLHHISAPEGNLGPASVQECRCLIAELNGAPSNINIPAKDRRGVYNHLAAHLRDAGLEPPELKTGKARECEHRAFPLVELRVEKRGDDDKPVIVGHAAVFNKLSEELWGFREQIAPGAFKKTIKESDIRALFNHDANFVLGRNTAGTLSLKEDKQGLAVEITPPDTGWARDLMASMERGDVDQMSIGFLVVRQTWTEDKDKDEETLTRTIEEARLFDVSVVTFPAYTQTDASVRSGLEIPETEIDFPALVRSSVKVESGADVTESDRDIFTRAIEYFSSHVAAPGDAHATPAVEPSAPEPEPLPEPVPVQDSETLRRRLELARAK